MLRTSHRVDLRATYEHVRKISSWCQVLVQPAWGFLVAPNVTIVDKLGAVESFAINSTQEIDADAVASPANKCAVELLIISTIED